MSPLLILPLPSPAHDLGHEAPEPRRAALECLGLARWLQRLGARTLLLPPPACPQLAQLQRHGFADPAELPDQAPWLLPAIWSPEHLGAGLGCPLPGVDRADGRDRLRLAPSAAEAGRAEALRRLLGDCLLPALPAAAPTRDRGDRNHLRLGPQDNGLHCFAAHAALGMPAQLLPRKAAPGQDREAQLCCARGLRPGRTVLAARDWRGLEAGAADLRQLACGAGHRLLLHERCLLDQSLSLSTCERLLPELRCEVVPKGRLSLREAAWYGAFAGLPLAEGEQHRLLVADHTLAHKPSRLLLESWRERGLIDELHGCPCDHLDPHGGPGRIVLDCGPGWAEQPGHDAGRLARLEELIAERYPDRLPENAAVDPAFAASCAQSVAALEALLLPAGD